MNVPEASKKTASALLALLLSGGRAVDAQPATESKSMATSNSVATAHTHTNRLAGEKSPYLLQHQFNPVDWQPWGEAAFAEAEAGVANP